MITTENTTTENNKIIAEFMGWELKHNPNISQKTWNNKEKGYCKDKDSTFIEYSNDWNWLMEVVEKIENLQFKNKNSTHKGFDSFAIEINKVRCDVTHYGDFTHNLHIGRGANRLECVYNAMVYTIKWYNLQNS